MGKDGGPHACDDSAGGAEPHPVASSVASPVAGPRYCVSRTGIAIAMQWPSSYPSCTDTRIVDRTRCHAVTCRPRPLGVATYRGFPTSLTSSLGQTDRAHIARDPKSARCNFFGTVGGILNTILIPACMRCQDHAIMLS